MTTLPQLRILVLSTSCHPNLARDALQAGACGYLLKTLSIDELAQAIRNAYEGKLALAPEVSDILGTTGTSL